MNMGNVITYRQNAYENMLNLSNYIYLNLFPNMDYKALFFVIESTTKMQYSEIIRYTHHGIILSPFAVTLSKKSK